MRIPRYTLAALLAVGAVGTLTAAASADPGPAGDRSPLDTVKIVACPDDVESVPAQKAVPAQPGSPEAIPARPGGPEAARAETATVELKDGKVYINGKEAGSVAGMVPATKLPEGAGRGNDVAAQGRTALAEPARGETVKGERPGAICIVAEKAR